MDPPDEEPQKKQRYEEAPMTRLPLDTFAQILELLGEPWSWPLCSLVCKAWRDLVEKRKRTVIFFNETGVKKHESAIPSLNLLFSKMVNLTKLHLVDYRLLTDEGLQIICQSMPNLETFAHIHNREKWGVNLGPEKCMLSGSSWKHLSNLKKLRLLSLGTDEKQCPITDELANAIKDLPNLTKLRIKRGQFSREGLLQLAGMKELKALNLHLCSIDFAAVAEYFTRLKALWFSKSESIDKEWIAITQQLTQLNELHVLGFIQNNLFERIERLQNLKKFSFLFNTLVTDDGLKHVAALKELEEFNMPLTFASVTGAFLEQLASLPNLKSICLQQSAWVTPEALPKFVFTHPVTVGISGTSLATKLEPNTTPNHVHFTTVLQEMEI